VSHGIDIFLTALERSRYKLLQICQGCRVYRKNRDKLITPTVRVSKSAVIFFVMHEFSTGYDAFFVFEQELSFETV
jgi:hypothetical protein